CARGTGKDFVRSLRIPKDLAAAIDVAQNGQPRTVDVGQARFVAWDDSEAQAYFANFAGAGISGAIARRANVSSKAAGGRISFLWGAVAVVPRWESAAGPASIDRTHRTGPSFGGIAVEGDHPARGQLGAPHAAPG